MELFRSDWVPIPMVPQPKVLVFVGTYLPGYKSGGPVRSIAGLVECLGGEIDFRIVTLDRDLGDIVPFPGIESGVWLNYGKAQVLYLSPSSLDFISIYRLLLAVKADVLYLNSFFSFRFSIIPMLARALGARGQASCILAVRGEFAPSALSLKPIRKRLWLMLTRHLSSYRQLRYQASSVFEATHIRNVIGMGAEVVSVPIMVASDLPILRELHSESNPDPNRSKTAGKLRIAFLSRVSPMKNLLGAIDILQGMQADICFSIYGPKEDAAYWQECSARLGLLPPNVHVEIHPQVEHSQVAQVLSGYHVLLLPTLGENFGHVIFEALHAGVPVLISDRTPWRDLEARAAGWDLPLERIDLFRAALNRLVAMGDEEYHSMSAGAARVAYEFMDSSEATDANRAMFSLPAQPAPDAGTASYRYAGVPR